MTTLEKRIEIFLKQTGQFKKPLLLGFSGGSDSLALAHCLLHLKLPFHLAHFDHGWREKSSQERGELEKWALSHQLPFHTSVSSTRKKTELAAREERFAFFESLFKTKEFEALVLAHHQNDQNETILKRVLEGARLTNLKGMEPISYRGKIPIWRPLLEVPKQMILDYLKMHQLDPIEDETNTDSKYLRARMRTSIIPFLTKEFGKEVSSSLFHLGKQSSTLQDYLNLQTEKIPMISGPFGSMWDFAEAHSLEMEYTLSRFFPFSRSIHSRVRQALEKKMANHSIHFGEQILLVDRQKVFWIKRLPPIFKKKIPLHTGVIQENDWQWNILLEKNGGKVLDQDWLCWWKGKISLPLDHGHYELVPPSPYFRKRWNISKIPAFLRESLPTILKNGSPVAEFLTEKRGGDPPLVVTISINPRQ
jgi:tRNA(Ile)-lysidine synthase